MNLSIPNLLTSARRVRDAFSIGFLARHLGKQQKKHASLEFNLTRLRLADCWNSGACKHRNAACAGALSDSQAAIRPVSWQVSRPVTTHDMEAQMISGSTIKTSRTLKKDTILFVYPRTFQLHRTSAPRRDSKLPTLSIPVQKVFHSFRPQPHISFRLQHRPQFQHQHGTLQKVQQRIHGRWPSTRARHEAYQGRPRALQAQSLLGARPRS